MTRNADFNWNDGLSGKKKRRPSCIDRPVRVSSFPWPLSIRLCGQAKPPFICICLSATATIVGGWGSLLQIVFAEDIAPLDRLHPKTFQGPPQSADEGGPF